MTGFVEKDEGDCNTLCSNNMLLTGR